MVASYLPKISIIIPCYFANEDFILMTETCLDSLMPIDAEIIVVDDGSPMKAVLDPTVKQIVRTTNGGYAKAVNTGLKAATGDVLIISNNDIDFIDPFWVIHITNPLLEGYDIVSIRTTDSDGWEVDDKITNNDKFGSLWAMKREVYDVLGGLDETYGKGYFEDLDYHRRAEDAAFKIGKNHAGLVHHYGKTTFKELDPDDRAFAEARRKFIDRWGFDRL